MTYNSYEQVRAGDPVVHRILRAGGTVGDCVVALANQKERLVARVMELELIAPKKIRADGQVWIYRCPDHLVPEPANGPIRQTDPNA